MWDNLVVKKIFDYCELIRLNKPIGFLLLMWPCWFGLAILKTETSKLIFWYLLFLIGSFLMRSAGCIINDIIDIDFDQKVTRTKFRPLASKKLSSNILIYIKNKQHHFLKNVLRIKKEDNINLFDGLTGEWLSLIHI